MTQAAVPDCATKVATAARLAAVPGIRRITAITGTQNTASRRLLERQGSISQIRFRAQTRSVTHTTRPHDSPGTYESWLRMSAE
jgi:RimJ/RimL family protein N-acetyltransferase